MFKKLTLTFVSLWLFGLNVYAQPQDAANRRKFEKASEVLNIGRYDEAAKLFEELNKISPNDTLINYRLGFSYAQSDNPDVQLKAIPHFEFALPSRSEDVPIVIHRYLANLYHKSYAFEKAIKLYSKYLTFLPKNSPEIKQIYRRVEMCKSGITLMKTPLDVVVENVGTTVNTKYTEYSPLINADENMLIYTTLRPINVIDPKSGESREAECILVASKGAGEAQWKSPKRLEGVDYNVSSVAITPDAHNIIVFVPSTGQGGVQVGDLHYGQIQDGKVTNLVALDAQVNSRGLENSGSLSSDEQTLYFASNRAGGFGGMDIYRMDKDKNGKWGAPVNLGADINTKYDEEAPFIHPDKKTLYFHSSGHNSMGNNDIFKTVMVNGKFTKPRNLGSPINTPYNDNFFVISPDGKKGYYSSDRNGGFGGQDIYFLGIPEEQDVVPLTLMKGKILAGDSLKPVPTKIRVIDKETKEPVRAVYNPDKTTGNYLIIFQPGKNYDMIIEAKGYAAHTINVNIPDQTYFHELYQQIHLKPVKQFDMVVGQEISVQNAFKDAAQGAGSDKMAVDARMAKEAMLVRDSLDVYDLMDNVIAASDSVAFMYLLDLMAKLNPVEKVNFKDTTVANKAVKGTFFFDEKDKMIPVVVGKDTIMTAPTLYTDAKDLHKNPPAASINAFVVSQEHEITRIYFDSDKSDLKAEYHAAIDKVLAKLKKNPTWGVEIDGYADVDGNKDYNKKLSNKRAQEVVKYLTDKGIARRRMVAKGLGQLISEGQIKKDNDKQKDRKVELKIMEPRKK